MIIRKKTPSLFIAIVLLGILMFQGCATLPKESRLSKILEPQIVCISLGKGSYGYYKKFNKWPLDMKTLVKFMLEEQRKTESSMESWLRDLEDVSFSVTGEGILIIKGSVANYLGQREARRFFARASNVEYTFDVEGENICTFDVNRALELQVNK